MDNPFIPTNVIFCTDENVRVIDCLPSGYERIGNVLFSVENSDSIIDFYSEKPTLIFLDEKLGSVHVRNSEVFLVGFDPLGLRDYSRKELPQVLACCGILKNDEKE